MNILADLIKEIRLETAFTPALVIREPFADSPPSPLASRAATILRPSVSVRLASGYEYRSAPYGSPGPSNWPTIKAGLLITAALGAAWMIARQL